MGDSKVFTLGTCHSVLADKCPLLQEAFPNPPLFPACFRMASWAPLGSCPLSAWSSCVHRARWLTVPDSCWMGCIREGQTDLEGGFHPAPSPLPPLFILDPTRCTATLQDGRPSGQGSGRGGVGLFGEGMVPCPQFSGQLTQKRETDLFGRPEGWKEQDGCTGKDSVKGKVW